MVVSLAHSSVYWSSDRVYCAKKDAVYELLPLFFTPLGCLGYGVAGADRCRTAPSGENVFASDSYFSSSYILK